MANDVAKALGYNEPRNAVRTHCKGGVLHPVPTPGGVQNMVVIPKSDVYRLVGRSELPEAEKFQDWIYEEVLPAINEKGGYVQPGREEEFLEKESESLPRLIPSPASRVSRP